MNDRMGHQLGSYRLVRLLGQGGFAEVYLGEHIHLKSYAAIKMLKAFVVDNEAEGFQKEARTIASLQHPHIIRVFDYNIVDGMPFLIMDYAPNGTLRNLYPRGSCVPLPAIISYVKQVAGALQYAHSEKIIHRDIKPENMLLGRENEVLLSDFGIATMSQSSRYSNAQDIVGTVGYMAPEQIQGKSHMASDQYALAIVAYEWLSGGLPFQGSFSEIAVQHMVVPPPSFCGKRPDIAPEIEDVIRTALAKDVHQRFVSVQAFADALEQASMPRSGPGDNVSTRVSLSAPATAFSPLASTQRVNYPGAGIRDASMPLSTSIASNNTVPAQRKHVFSRRSIFGIVTLAVIGGSVAAFEAYYNSRDLSKSSATGASSGVTKAPTKAPTAVPTKAPTAVPTKAPTAVPTEASMAAPTKAPFGTSWSQLTPLLYPAADNVAISVSLQQQDYIYMAGGYRGDSYSPNNNNTLYRYNIAVSQWEIVTSNFPGMYNNAVAKDGQQNLYFTGGYSPDSHAVTTLLYKCQPGTGALQQISLPGQIVFGYGGSMLADQNGQLYLTQGFMQPVDTHTSAGSGWYRYNIMQDQWETLRPLPVGVAYAVLAFDHQGNVVLMGGAKDTEQINASYGIYRYNLAQDEWTEEQETLPQALNGAASCVVGNGQIIVVGGYDPTNNVTLSNVWMIDPDTLDMRPLASLPGGGSHLGAAACDGAGNVYVVRGISNDAHVPTKDFFSLS